MITIAKREEVPLHITLWGQPGSGKTYSSLLLASGLAPENGKIVLLHSEGTKGGGFYASDQTIIDNLPNGEYYTSNITMPFTPSRYIDKIKECCNFGADVLIIDSASHWWEGTGGCLDMATNSNAARVGMPNWFLAKTEYKKVMFYLSQCPFHVIYSVRGEQKTAFDNGKFIDIGVQPIQYKSFMFDVMMSFKMQVDSPGKPVSFTKCPGELTTPLTEAMRAHKGLITKEFGEILKQWNKKGVPINEKLYSLKSKCAEAAMKGVLELDNFLITLNNEDKELIKLTENDFKLEMRTIAQNADDNQCEEYETPPLDFLK